MAEIVLTPPPFPADLNVFYQGLLDNLSGKRSVYTKDRTAVGLRTVPITITGTADPLAILDIYHSTFDRPSALLTTVQANTLGVFSFQITMERGVNLIQAKSATKESNIVSLNAFNLHLLMESIGNEFLTQLLPLIEQAIADQNIEDTQNIISGGLRAPTTQGLRDDLGVLVDLKRPGIFSAQKYRDVLRAILQRVIRQTTLVDAQREIFRAFTTHLPHIDEFYRRQDFRLSSDLFVNVKRSAPFVPSLTVHLNPGFIHVGTHQNLRVVAGDYSVVNNATNYLVADGSFGPDTTFASVYVTAVPIIPAFVDTPDVEVRFQNQMRLSLSDRFDGADGDTGWIPYAAHFFIPLTVQNPFVPVYIKFRDILGDETDVLVIRAEVRVFATIVASGGDITNLLGVEALNSTGSPIVLSLRDAQYRFLVEDQGPGVITLDEKAEATKYVHLAKPAHEGAYVKFSDETNARVA